MAVPCAARHRPARPECRRSISPHEGARSPRNASYDIDVRLDHATRTLHGRETHPLAQHQQREPTSELQFHLYWNAWRDAQLDLAARAAPGRHTRAPTRDDAWGSIDVTAIAAASSRTARCVDLTPQQRFIAPDDGNAADRTVMAVTLPRDVAPNETVEIELEWTRKVPRTVRAHRLHRRLLLHRAVVPEARRARGHRLEHAPVPLGHRVLRRLRRLRRPHHRAARVRRRRLGTRGCSAPTTPTTTTTHRYRGEDIHDFAWTASPHFIDVRRTFEHPTLPRVEMRLLLQPEHRGQEDRHFAATAATLQYYGEWFGAYPYGHITIVDPAYQSGSGGMEYPTLFTAGARWLAPRAVTQPER